MAKELYDDTSRYHSLSAPHKTGLAAVTMIHIRQRLQHNKRLGKDDAGRWLKDDLYKMAR